MKQRSVLVFQIILLGAFTSFSAAHLFAATAPYLVIPTNATTCSNHLSVIHEPISGEYLIQVRANATNPNCRAQRVQWVSIANYEKVADRPKIIEEKNIMTYPLTTQAFLDQRNHLCLNITSDLSTHLSYLCLFRVEDTNFFFPLQVHLGRNQDTIFLDPMVNHIIQLTPPFGYETSGVLMENGDKYYDRIQEVTFLADLDGRDKYVDVPHDFYNTSANLGIRLSNITDNKATREELKDWSIIYLVFQNRNGKIHKVRHVQPLADRYFHKDKFYLSTNFRQIDLPYRFCEVHPCRMSVVLAKTDMERHPHFKQFGVLFSQSFTLNLNATGKPGDRRAFFATPWGIILLVLAGILVAFALTYCVTKGVSKYRHRRTAEGIEQGLM